MNGMKSWQLYLGEAQKTWWIHANNEDNTAE